jgi:NAD(P)-dependent dehydrogenase (short-subunit alcohol dehydrogenase family)
VVNAVFNRGDRVEELEDVSSKMFQTNVVGNIHLFNLFLPLVMKGKVKKVIAISSGHADLDLINNLEVEVSALYSASKAALNVIVAKFNAQYKKDGVLFVSISPGVVDVGHNLSGTYPCIQNWQNLNILLMQIHSHSKSTPGLGEIYECDFSLCA